MEDRCCRMGAVEKKLRRLGFQDTICPVKSLEELCQETLSVFWDSNHVGRGVVTPSCRTIVLLYRSASSTCVASKLTSNGHL